MALTIPVSEIVEKSKSPLLGKHESWGRVPLGDVATILNGFAFKSSEFSNDRGMPLIRIRDVGKNNTETNYLGEYDVRYIVEPGDLLVGMDGDFNCGRWHGPRGLLNQRVCKITLKSDTYLPKFLDYTLPGYLKAINDVTSSVTVKHLSSKSIEEIPLPLPPKEVQQSLVAEIEKQFSRLDEAVASLKRTKANLKRYKAAVLKAAVEGKLTEDWRKQHPDVESASKLLERILDEPSAKRNSSSLESLDCSRFCKLPSNWCWARIEDIGEVQLGRQRAPRYHSGRNMRPYLRVQNVFEDRIDLDDVMEMDFPPGDFEKFKLAPGDILLNEGQSPELLGRPAIYRGEMPDACFTNTLIRFRVNTLMKPNYPFLVFRAYMRNRRFTKEGTITTNIAHLSAGRFAKIEFPLPSLQEQKFIVAEVERRLSVIDELEATVDANLTRADRLRQSILQRAFSGSLI